MKKTLTTILFSFTIIIYSQSTETSYFYLDSLRNIVSKEKHKFTRVIENYNNSNDLYLVADYYQSGKINRKSISKSKKGLTFDGPFVAFYENGNKKKESNYTDGKINGISIEYYENGTKKQESNYTDGKINGARIDYYENGNKKRETNFTNGRENGALTEWYENQNKKSINEAIWDAESKTTIYRTAQFWNENNKQTIINGNGYYDDPYIHGEVKDSLSQGIWEGKNIEKNYTFIEKYKNGKLVSGTSKTEKGEEYKYTVSYVDASPKDGMEDFVKTIYKNFIIANKSKFRESTGIIKIHFVVLQDGAISEVKILSELDYGLDNELTKMVESFGKWTPTKHRGRPFRKAFTIPFKLPNTLKSILAGNDRVGNDKITYFKEGSGQKASASNYDSYKIIKDGYIEKDEYTQYDYNKAGALVRETTFKSKLSKSYVPGFKIIEYYDNGTKKSEQETYKLGKDTLAPKIVQFWNKDNIQKVINGNGDYYEDDDNKLLKGQVINGFREGIWIENDKKNKFSSTETYSKGKFISGVSKTEDGQEYNYSVFFEKPKPKSGMEDLYTYIKRNFRISKEAKINRVSGKIYLTFIVDKNSQATNIRVLRGLGYDLDEEAIRVVKDYDKWIPGKRKGIPVPVALSLPITIQSTN